MAQFKLNFRRYTVVLVACYLAAVVVFHANLEPSEGHQQKLSLKPLPTPSAQPVVSLRRGQERVGNDVIEERNINRALKVDPDSRAGLIIREYKAPYVAAKNTNVTARTDLADDVIASQLASRKCRGDRDVRERFEFVPVISDLFVYSVFWDARHNDFDNKDGGAHLRIMTLIKARLAKTTPPIRCWFRHNDTWLSAPASYYEMCENHGRPYGGFILSCKVPSLLISQDKTPLCSVHISPSDHPPNASDVTTQFAIIDTTALETQRDFSMCVAPLYGDLEFTPIIEFLELSTLLGAKHVTFYDFQLSVQVRKLIEWYASQGRATLLPWKLNEEVDKVVWYHGQLISILDCLFRNMATSKYLLFNDIDEYVIPYEFADWSDMMRQLDGPDVVGLQFNSAFVDPNKQEDVPASVAHLRSIAHVRRTALISRVRTKCLVKPQLLFEPGIHHISKPLLAHLRTLRLDLPQALLLHHRTCQSNFGMRCRDFVEDDVIRARYGDALQERFDASLEAFSKTL